MSSNRLPESDPLAPHRGRLLGLAYRMLGSRSDAEDVVQDAYLRFAGAQDVHNPEAFLVTIVTRLCLDRLKSARAQREIYVGPWLPEPVCDAEGLSPDAATELADDLSFALLLALDRLSPLERAAFLLHDVFDMQFSEIARDDRPDRGGLPAIGDPGPPRGARRTPGAVGDTGRSRAPSECFQRRRCQRRRLAPGRIAARGRGCDDRWRWPQVRSTESDLGRRQDRTFLHRRGRKKRQPRHPHRADDDQRNRWRPGLYGRRTRSQPEHGDRRRTDRRDLYRAQSRQTAHFAAFSQH